jgi:hypothetical protein
MMKQSLRAIVRFTARDFVAIKADRKVQTLRLRFGQGDEPLA